MTSAVAGGDFNNDGKYDLTAAIGPTVWVSLGKGDGSFQAGIASAGPSGCISKNATTFFIATMIGNGDGTFQAPIETDFASMHTPQNVVMADLNGDGVLDLAIASGMNVQTRLSFLFGMGRMRTRKSLAPLMFRLLLVAQEGFRNRAL